MALHVAWLCSTGGQVRGSRQSAVLVDVTPMGKDVMVDGMYCENSFYRGKERGIWRGLRTAIFSKTTVLK
jgi:hypothetical protein